MDLFRVIIISFSQPLTLIILIIIAYKILKRKKDFSTIILSLFFFLYIIAFILNILYLLLSSIIANPLILFLLYSIVFYFTILSPVFIIIFILNLLNNSKRISLFTFLIYAIFVFMLLFIPEGIIISDENNWVPIYSLRFLIIVYIYLTAFYTIPILIFSLKVYKFFEDKTLKKKMKYLITGAILELPIYYGAILFNTQQIPLFRVIWPPISSTLLIITAILIYYSVGRNL